MRIPLKQFQCAQCGEPIVNPGSERNVPCPACETNQAAPLSPELFVAVAASNLDGVVIIAPRDWRDYEHAQPVMIETVVGPVFTCLVPLSQRWACGGHGFGAKVVLRATSEVLEEPHVIGIEPMPWTVLDDEVNKVREKRRQEKEKENA